MQNIRQEENREAHANAKGTFLIPTTRQIGNNTPTLHTQRRPHTHTSTTLINMLCLYLSFGYFFSTTRDSVQSPNRRNIKIHSQQPFSKTEGSSTLARYGSNVVSRRPFPNDRNTKNTRQQNMLGEVQQKSVTSDNMFPYSPGAPSGHCPRHCFLTERREI